MPSSFPSIDGRRATLIEDSAGIRHFPDLLGDQELHFLDRLSAGIKNGWIGTRVFDDGLQFLLNREGSLMKLACDLIGPEAMAVRAIFFNKTSNQNWSTPWHQDRTIPVRSKHVMNGYETWSVKNGVHHVEPPISILENMITLKVHIDACTYRTGPITVAEGSHQIDRVQAVDASGVAQKFRERICTANAGDVWAMSSTILHASSRSTSEKSRRVLHIDFSASQLPTPLEWFSLN